MTESLQADHPSRRGASVSLLSQPAAGLGRFDRTGRRGWSYNRLRYVLSQVRACSFATIFLGHPENASISPIANRRRDHDFQKHYHGGIQSAERCVKCSRPRLLLVTPCARLFLAFCHDQHPHACTRGVQHKNAFFLFSEMWVGMFWRSVCWEARYVHTLNTC